MQGSYKDTWYLIEIPCWKAALKALRILTYLKALYNDLFINEDVNVIDT